MYPSVIIIVDVAVIDVVYSSILSTTTSEMAKMDKNGQTRTEDRDNKKVLLQWMCSCLDNFFVVIVVVIRSLARSLRLAEFSFSAITRREFTQILQVCIQVCVCSSFSFNHTHKYTFWKVHANIVWNRGSHMVHTSDKFRMITNDEWLNVDSGEIGRCRCCFRV